MTAATPDTSKSSPANANAGASPANPAGMPSEVSSEVRVAKRRRPMSMPTRRLETTQLPGYHLHWIKSENIPQALQASYDYVLDTEVEINTRNVGLNTVMGSTADMSNRVTVQYGGDTLYLMKLEESLYNEDMAALAAKNRDLLNQIFRGEMIAGSDQPNPGDTAHTYIKKDMTELKGADVKRMNTPLFQRRYK